VFANRSEFLGEPLHDELCLRETSVECRELIRGNIIDVIIRFEIIEIAVAISFGDARSRQGALGLITFGAVARNCPDEFRTPLRRTAGLIGGDGLRTSRIAFHNFPAAALAVRTIWLCHGRRISAARLERKRTSLCKARTSVESDETIRGLRLKRTSGRGGWKAYFSTRIAWRGTARTIA